MNFLELQKKINNKEITPDEAYLVQIEMLNAKLDPRLVSQRQQSGQSLSYIEAHAAIQILNLVFGYGNWDMHVTDFKEMMKESYDKNNKTMYKVGYAAMGKLIVRFANGITGEYGDSGYGSGITSTGYGDACESALKESESDLLKRCARHIGIALQLYDKQQRRVGYSKYTVMLDPIDLDVVKPLAVADTTKTKEFLTELGKTKLVELTQQEIETLFDRLVS